MGDNGMKAATADSGTRVDPRFSDSESLAPLVNGMTMTAKTKHLTAKTKHLTTTVAEERKMTRSSPSSGYLANLQVSAPEKQKHADSPGAASDRAEQFTLLARVVCRRACSGCAVA